MILHTSSPWIMTATGSGIAIAKQCGCKVQHQVATPLSNNNPGSSHLLSLPQDVPVVKWEVAGVSCNDQDGRAGRVGAGCELEGGSWWLVQQTVSTRRLWDTWHGKKAWAGETY